MATPSSGSIEYDTLARFLGKLTIAFKGSHSRIATELVSSGVIPPNVLDKALALGVDDETKATSILKSALDQVQVTPGKYYNFMAVPSFNEECFCPLHEEITTFYESLKAEVIRRTPPKAIATQTTPDLLEAAEPQTSSQEVQCDVTNGGTKSEDDIFRCPCGNCSLAQYLDEGCPKSTSQQFPYLDVCSLDEGDREDLSFKLSQDVMGMVRSFAKLTSEVRNSLDERDISVQNLVAHILYFGAYDSKAMQKPLLSDVEEKLQQAQTAHDVFIVLRPHMSFFNHELLKHITDCEKLCTNDDRKRMNKYCTNFKEFCRRKIFEVPSGAFGQSTALAKKSKRKLFAVLTKDEGERNLVFVNEAKHKIASILEVMPSALHLHRIDEGSVILVFSVPEFVAREIFPLEPSTAAELKSEGFHIFVPSTIKDHAESPKVCTKSRRFSWPLGSKKDYGETKITKSFSRDSLAVKGDPRKFVFFYSAKNGYVKSIKALIRASTPEILCSRWNGMTALMLAAKYGHTEVVRALLPLYSQAVVDFQCDGMTALMLASKRGHTDTVQVLIDAGVNTSAKDKGGKTALMLAAQGGHTETVKALIQAGANVYATCEQFGWEGGKTALMMAGKGGHTETVKVLIEAGANVNATCKQGWDGGKTALMMAAQGGHTETVEVLIQAGANVYATCIQELLDNGKTALMIAAQHGHTETVKALIEAGAIVNVMCRQFREWPLDDGKTALMMAAQGGHTETVKALIEAGADINATCNQVRLSSRNRQQAAGRCHYKDGKTALMMAAEGGHTETVKALMKAGADTSCLEPESLQAAIGGNTSDELFYYKRSSSRTGSLAGSSAGSHCSFG